MGRPQGFGKRLNRAVPDCRLFVQSSCLSTRAVSIQGLADCGARLVHSRSRRNRGERQFANSD